MGFLQINKSLKPFAVSIYGWSSVTERIKVMTEIQIQYDKVLTTTFDIAFQGMRTQFLGFGRLLRFEIIVGCGHSIGYLLVEIGTMIFKILTFLT